MTYQAGLVFCNQDSKIASSFKRLLERFLDIDIRMFEGGNIETFADECHRIFVFATPTFVSITEYKEMCERLFSHQIDNNLKRNIIPVLTERAKPPFGIKHIHPLTLYRLTKGHPTTEYVRLFDGIKDEKALNELDFEMLSKLRKVFPPKDLSNQLKE